MKGNPYTRWVEAMRREGKKNNQQPLAIGTVKAVNPLQVEYNGVLISSNIKCSLPQMPETVEEALEKEEGISGELKGFLKELYNALNLKVGDHVILQKTDTGIFILGKA